MKVPTAAAVMGYFFVCDIVETAGDVFDTVVNCCWRYSSYIKRVLSVQYIVA